ncbi:malectin domain-containing carbohydrate-binding protein [Hymenobacter volaticus]|uniref:Malectin domain-containing carbohydrate-binding protein n=1 Tax=Hymenobacter volaticus TaxID=2932254 RepID=A0ABY4GCE5_9BACT|nr:malectin domain-containing carbohydrate-binding protein [Hymenobacter volaticus]UOQ68577.1 malectin domain-containing carbohydrate-binding protein [Hymenobacter volaticus]
MDYNLYSPSRCFCQGYLLLLAIIGFCFSTATPTASWAQSSQPRTLAPGLINRMAAAAGNDKEKKKKKAKLPPEPLSGARLANAQYNFSFSPSALKGITLENPTSLQFGPDGRLYVSQQNGLIKAFTIKRNGVNDYSVTATETISLINSIPNHDDNGQLNASVQTRQVTGILVKGTDTNPVLYVSSSDSRIGGPGGDLNLDTNSGIVSRLTRTNGTWSKIDLVRGLPRSEENHSSNGMQLDTQTNTLLLAQGGHTNAGSPSVNFAFTPEYALSAAILSINLTAIDALPTLGSGNTAYKYDLPTLDDPTRAGNPDAMDPFGGNDGLNQAKIVANGPVQIFSPGYRNPYDLVLTRNRRLYTIDNGANQGWGGYPENEGTPNVTNNYVNGEPGSSTPSATEGTVNNLDNLHYIGNLTTYSAGTYYGGHPAPTRANPNGAGLYTHNGTSGVWRNSKSGTNPLPTDWPPVAKTNTIEGDFQMPGSAASKSLLTFSSSTNGMCEYTASNFSNALQGSLLACTFDGTIAKITLTADGTGVTNPYDPNNKLNSDLPFASNFGSTPLDVTAQGDTEIFPGTVWAATYGASAITVFEPQDFLTCTGNYNSNDDDQDGYTNADEIDNGTQPCSAASRPDDANNNKISDLNDPDDDSDGLADNKDFFALDKDNGLATNLPIKYDLFNNYPGTGLFGLGFTGLMSNGDSIYSDSFEEQNLIAGGAVGSFSITNVAPGDAQGSLNTQEDAFQFGVKSTGVPFTIQSRLLGPFFNGKTPQAFQSQGIYLGTGDQNNYLKIAIAASGGVAVLQIVHENAGVPVVTNFALPGGSPSSTLDFYFSVNPATGTVQPKYAINGGITTNLGNPVQLSGALLAAVQSNKAYAVGLIATSRGSSPFVAKWDLIYVTADQGTGDNTAVYRINAGGGQVINSIGTFSADQYFSGGSVASSSVAIANTTDDAIYQSERYGTSTYAMPVPNGQYTVKLHFAEFYWTAAGQRVFDVTAEGTKMLAAYDILKKVGPNTATTETFNVNVTDGVLTLAFTPGTSGVDQPKISAIEVLKPVSASTHRINAGGPALTTSIGAFTADQYFSGGNASGGSNPIAGTEDDALYQTERWGSMTYNLPVSNGTYTVKLHFAEVYWNAVGQRVFDVSAEGNKVLSAYDIVKKVGQNTATTETFTVNVTDGQLTLAFAKGTAGADEPKVSAIEVIAGGSPSNTAPTANAGPDKTITLPTSSVVLTGSGTDPDGTIASYAWTQVSGPNNATFSSKTVAQPTVSGLVAGPYVFSLVVTDNGGLASPADQVAVTVNSAPGAGDTPLYRVNAGGGQVTNSIGLFAADQYFTGGTTFATSAGIAGTDDDAMYQTERYGTSFGYGFAVSSGKRYRVVLHFAEIYASTVGQRVFDVSIEGSKVLDNYDIFKKVGTNVATTETFTTSTVADDVLNINFSSLAADGGIDNAKISAIEIYTLPNNAAPVANAGPDKSVTLPTNSVVLSGSGSDPDGSVSGFTWTQVSGPNNATFSSKTVAAPTVSGLVAGPYVFSLVVTDNSGLASAADQVTVTVSSTSTGTAVYRLNAGGPAASTSVGNFAADQYASGGFPSSSPNTAIAGTTDDVLYQTERWGTMTYALPVSNGTYTVKLHFAEVYWNAVGQRVFDVSAEGTKVLTAYDILSKVGRNTARVETFTVTVNDGSLTLAFAKGTAGKDEPKVSAIEVLTGSGARSSAEASLSTLAVPGSSPLAADKPVLSYSSQVILYPNPSADGLFSVGLPAAFQGEVSYVLVSSLGKTVSSGKRTVSGGAPHLFFDFSQQMLAEGVYYLQLEGNKAQARVKLMRK